MVLTGGSHMSARGREIKDTGSVCLLGRGWFSFWAGIPRGPFYIFISFFLLFLFCFLYFFIDFAF
jgi:hypothetical protein